MPIHQMLFGAASGGVAPTPPVTPPTFPDDAYVDVTNWICSNIEYGLLGSLGGGSGRSSFSFQSSLLERINAWVPGNPTIPIVFRIPANLTLGGKYTHPGNGLPTDTLTGERMFGTSLPAITLFGTTFQSDYGPLSVDATFDSTARIVTATLPFYLQTGGSLPQGWTNPSALSITIINYGIICGAGGRGGNSDYQGGNGYLPDTSPPTDRPRGKVMGGRPGSAAIVSNRPLTIYNYGMIAGGGGGGAAPALAIEHVVIDHIIQPTEARHGIPGVGGGGWASCGYTTGTSTYYFTNGGYMPNHPVQVSPGIVQNLPVGGHGGNNLEGWSGDTREGYFDEPKMFYTAKSSLPLNVAPFLDPRIPNDPCTIIYPSGAIGKNGTPDRSLVGGLQGGLWGGAAGYSIWTPNASDITFGYRGQVVGQVAHSGISGWWNPVWDDANNTPF